MPDLLAHAVDAVRTQQVHGLLDQVGSAAVEHPEAQVLQELGLRGGRVQLPGGTKTVLGSVGGNGRIISVMEFISGKNDSEGKLSQMKLWVLSN